jgi:hypothetical protein
MKPLPPPPVPGNTDWERFDNAAGMLLSAPRAAFGEAGKEAEAQREKRRPAKKPD